MARGKLESQYAGAFRTLFEVGYLGDLPDELLLERFRSGQGELAQSAFSAVIERHGPMVLGVCRRLLGDSHLAEDAFQATFLILARRAGSLRDQSILASWLHRVASRVALRLKIRTDRRVAREIPSSHEPAIENPDVAEREEIRAIIDQEIERLGNDQRLPIILCFLEGLTHEQASERLRLPIGTVKSRLARGRLRLQGRLIRRGVAPPSAMGFILGLGSLSGEAGAAVPLPLVQMTSRHVFASIFKNGVTTAIPALVSSLVKEELGSMIAIKLKFSAIVALVLIASAATLGIAFASIHPEKTALKTDPEPVPPPAQIQDSKGVATVKVSASGQVVDPGGKPIPGARVLLRSQSQRSVWPPQENQDPLPTNQPSDILAETRTDAEGRFRFQEVVDAGLPGKNTVFDESNPPWDVVALMPGRALAWKPLISRSSRRPIVLTLGEEAFIRGRMIEPGGRPIPGAKVEVVGIDPLGSSLQEQNTWGSDQQLQLSYSLDLVSSHTDADGRFVIGGIPKNWLYTINASAPNHTDQSAYAATTDKPQPDQVDQTVGDGIDVNIIVQGQPANSTKLVEFRLPVHTGEFTIESPVADHVLLGRVVTDIDGKPAQGARIFCGAIHQVTDQDGNFRIRNLKAGMTDIHVVAEGSRAAPFDGKVMIPENPREFRHEIRLPKGLTLTGRVVDGASGEGVGKVSVLFDWKTERMMLSSLFGFQTKTEPDGRFRLVVPAGKGTVLLQNLPDQFRQPPRRVVGQADDPRFTRSVEGGNAQTIDLGDFKVDQGRVVLLRVTDPDDKPAPDVGVEIQAQRQHTKLVTEHDGRCKVVGLSDAQETVVDLTDSARKLGATVSLGGPGGLDEVEVKLKPLVALEGRVLDDDGKPLTGSIVRLYRNTICQNTDGPSFCDICVGGAVEVDEEGSYTFDILIPEQIYRIQVECEGHASLVSKEFKARMGETTKLDGFRLPVADIDIKGVVIDSQGKPMAGIGVGQGSRNDSFAMMGPANSVWFQVTDEQGRFSLRKLPRGTRLSVGQKMGIPNEEVEKVHYFDLSPGQREIVIQIRD